MRQQQSGFLLISSVIILVILSALAAILVELFSTNELTYVHQLSAHQALYLAEAGLQNAKLKLLGDETKKSQRAKQCVQLNNRQLTVGAGEIKLHTKLFQTNDKHTKTKNKTKTKTKTKTQQQQCKLSATASVPTQQKYLGRRTLELVVQL